MIGKLLVASIAFLGGIYLTIHYPVQSHELLNQAVQLYHRAVTYR